MIGRISEEGPCGASHLDQCVSRRAGRRKGRRLDEVCPEAREILEEERDVVVEAGTQLRVGVIPRLGEPSQHAAIQVLGKM